MQQQRNITGISLLFAPGQRPAASEIVERLAGAAGTGNAVHIGHRPPDDHGRLELVASGLTFDLRGLAPGMAASIPPLDHVFGLPKDIEKYELEAISIAPGSHIAAGGAMMPIVRAMIGIAADLTLQLPVTAVCWNPAGSWMDPRYFGRVVVNWLSGGPFPVLGLTGVRRRLDGAYESGGLAFFTGQEVCVPARPGEAESDTVRLASRVIEHLVRKGALDKAETLAGPDGEVLLAEPAADRRSVMVSRAG